MVQVVLTFSMQGLGNFTNTAVLCVLLAIYSSTQPDKRTHVYTPWRYAIKLPRHRELFAPVM